MSLPIIYRDEALDDLIAARDWYDRESPGLGDKFTEAVEQLIDRIEAMPNLYAATFRDVRPAKVRKFPYVVYYRVLKAWIEILGVMHGRRDPESWQDRA